MFILTIFLIVPAIFAYYSAPRVKIEQGYLRGQYVQTIKGRIISSYTGIPYAEPPVGHLRFEAPRPAIGWHGFRNATELHAICPQTNIFNADPTVRGNEDCLYLNVYTPQVTCCNFRNLPVMIYFHGGGFIVGNGNYDEYGPTILLDKDIVLVVPNFRLGPLGFLSTGDQVVPGNNGLKDQNLVIQWVKVNIFQFGGDPDRITLFGQSAGGVAAHLHMLSPLSKYLIKGVIAQSGTALAPWALAAPGQAERNFKRLAHTLNCFGETHREVVDCLKHVDVVDILRAHDTLYQWSWHPLTAFRPVIEPNSYGAFLPDDPVHIIKSGQAANIPFMTGITTEDGATVSASIIGNPQLLEEFSNNLKELLPITLFYDETSPHRDAVTKKLIEFYFGNMKIDSSSIVQLTDIFTEGHFLVSAKDAIRLHLKYVHAPVYNYAFGYRSSVSFSSIYGDPVNNYGVSHSDDLLHLFPVQRSFPNYTRSYSDRIVDEIMTTLWTNFAATGNPTPKALTPGDRWERVMSKDLEYLLINGVSDVSMREGLYRNRTDFWDNLPLHADHTR